MRDTEERPPTVEETLAITTNERDELARLLTLERAETGRLRQEAKPLRESKPGDFSMSPDEAAWVLKDLDDLYGGDSEPAECNALLWLLCGLDVCREREAKQ